MSDTYGRARMQSPGTAERQPTAEELRRRAASQPKPAPAKKSSTLETIGVAIQRLKGNPNSESHSYNWRSRNNLKRGQ